MNFLFSFGAGFLGHLMAPRLLYHANQIYHYFDYPKIEINTRIEPVVGNAILAFLSHHLGLKTVIEQSNTNCGISSINLYGITQSGLIPTAGYEYREYYYGTLVSFGIKVIGGERQHDLIYTVFGNYYEDKLENIINSYKSYFYQMKYNRMSVPVFRFEKYWIFEPFIISTTSEILSSGSIGGKYIDKLKQIEIVESITASKVRSVLLHGPPKSGKKYITCLTGEKMERSIYVPDIHLKPLYFLEAVRNVPKHSILLIQNIDIVFTKGFSNDHVNKDTFLGIFDAMQDNVLLIFTTSNITPYQEFTYLFQENRIAHVFNVLE